MNRNRAVVFILLAALSLPVAALAAPAGAARPGNLEPGQVRELIENPRLLARFLRLTNDQVTQMNALLRTLQASVEPLRASRATLCGQLRTALAATPADTAAVGNGSLALYQNKQQVSAARATFDTAFKAILTPEQLARYNALLQLFNNSPERSANLLGDCPPPARQ